jgi:cytoskeletal protein RodZ
MDSFGENLRRERELRGIGLRDIADSTKISVRFLQALEQDRLDVLPGGLFPRAFLRQYARYLGLDADRLAEDFVMYHRLEAEPEPLAEAPSRKPTKRPTTPRGAAIAAALLLVIGVLWLLQSRPSSSDNDAPVPSPPPNAAATLDRVYPPPETLAAVTPPEPEALTLTLRAQQSCWVAVEVDGERVLDRVLSSGETRTLEAESEIILSVGNAGGLAFAVNDRPGMPLGQSGEVRRNIVINAQSLPSLVEEAAAARSQSS